MQDDLTIILDQMETKLSELVAVKPYEYHPDASKLIQHAMQAVQDEFGERGNELRQKLMLCFVEVARLQGRPIGNAGEKAA